MNLMDIRNKVWDMEALKATAPSLKKKLPSLAAAGQVIGPVSAYFVNKYGLNPEALATTWTGDNPASVIGARPDQARSGRDQPRHERHFFWHDGKMPDR